MTYPAIVYSRDDVDILHADNEPYKIQKRYEVIVIDRDPDSAIPDKIAKLPTARFVRNYVADNLNHDIYSLSF